MTVACHWRQQVDLESALSKMIGRACEALLSASLISRHLSNASPGPTVPQPYC